MVVNRPIIQYTIGNQITQNSEPATLFLIAPLDVQTGDELQQAHHPQQHAGKFRRKKAAHRQVCPAAAADG